MALTVKCPSCLRVFRVSDSYAGQRGRCPECGEICQVPEVELPELEPLPTSHREDRSRDDDRDRDRDRYRDRDQAPRRRRRPEDDWSEWQRISLAYGIELWASAMLLIATALVLVANTILPDDPLDFNAEPNTAQMATAGVGVIVGMLGFIVLLVSRFFVLATPVRTAATLAKVSLGMLAVQFFIGLMGLCVVMAVLGAQQQGNNPDDAVALLVGMCMLGWLMFVAASEACHGFGLASVGKALRVDGLVTWGKTLAWAVVGGCVLVFIGFAVLGTWAEMQNPNGQPLNPAAQQTEDILALACIVLMMVLLLLYFMLNVLAMQAGRRAIQAIGERIERDERY